MELEKIVAVRCPKTGELVPVDVCEECEYFDDEYADYIVCFAYPGRLRCECTDCRSGEPPFYKLRLSEEFGGDIVIWCEQCYEENSEMVEEELDMLYPVRSSEGNEIENWE